MDVQPKDLVTPVPNDQQEPKMYINGTYILGLIVIVCVVALGILAGVLKDKLPGEIVTAFVAIAGPAVAGLSGIYQRAK